MTHGCVTPCRTYPDPDHGASKQVSFALGMMKQGWSGGLLSGVGPAYT